MTLDDRIYCLQRTPLTQEMASSLVKAHAFYLREEDDKADVIVSSIEKKCAEENIAIYTPKYAFN